MLLCLYDSEDSFPESEMNNIKDAEAIVYKQGDVVKITSAYEMGLDQQQLNELSDNVQGEAIVGVYSSQMAEFTFEGVHYVITTNGVTHTETPELTEWTHS